MRSSARPLVLAALVIASCARSKPIDVQPEPVASAPAPEAPPSAGPAPSSALGGAAPKQPAPDPPNWPEGYTPPEVWETRAVTVDGVKETWNLRWRSPPRFNGCAPWGWCGCTGLEWGLQGDLELTRERPDAPVERLDLGQLREGAAQIPGFVRTPLDDSAYDGKGRLVRPAKELAEVVKRPHAEVLKLRDYDHDGWAAEFVFQIGYWACGQDPSVLVGVSKANPHLHVFGTTEAPDQALVMTYLSSWDQILAARGKSVEVPQHICGDHGGGGHYTKLRFDPGGLHVLEDDDWMCDFDRSPPRRTVRLVPAPAAPSP